MIVADELIVTRDLRIPESALRERFVRATGPGGQHVNKVATAVQLRINLRRAGFLPEPVRERLLKLARRRINTRGELVIEARRYRSRERNRQDARRRLCDLVRKATVVPRVRRESRPSAGARARRLADKRRHAQQKRLRGAVGMQE